MSNDKLQQLKALALAATPGPWEATRQTDDECNFIGYFIEAGDKAISDDGTAPDHADALFIAAANPAVILALIAKVEATPSSANGAEGLPSAQEPKQAMTEPEIESLMLAAFPRTKCSQAYIAFARAIERAASPNKELVEALLDYKRLYEKVQPAGGWQGVYEMGNDALAGAGVDL